MGQHSTDPVNPEKTCTHRRAFLKSSAFLGGSALVASRFDWAHDIVASAQAGTLPAERKKELDEAFTTLYSVCLQCNTGCGMKVRILDGVAVKIDGNPYNPFTMVPSIPFSTPVTEAAAVDGALCPKGQAGIQTLYDPYRIVKVLKRAGKRGEGKWQTIPFDTAIREIVEGGVLFGKVRGEEKRKIEGLNDLWKLRDPKLAADMATALAEIKKKKGPEEKAAAVQEFKTRFGKHLDSLIDPNHPDLGPRNNQLCFVWGRLKGGRSEFIKRFANEAFGTTNTHGHTTVCQGSLYFTGKAMSDQFVEGKFGEGQKFYWQADTANVEFLLAIGSAYIEGGYGPTHHAQKLMKNLVDKKVKIAVVDPRFSKIASKAYKWLPIKPGTDAAFAQGMIRWIIENKRYDGKFLGAANRAAATAAGEQSWTNGTWLVKADGKFLRASEVLVKTRNPDGTESEEPLATKEKRVGKTGKEWEFDPFVVMQNGRPVAFDPNEEANAVVGDLFVDTNVGTIPVKTGLQLIYETAKERSLAQWAEICGLKEDDVVEIAKEFTSHGKKAVADPHRGVAQHTNGFYNVLSIYTLNALIGNWDWKGGLIKAATYSYDGSKEGQPYDLKKGLHPSRYKPFGISIIRHDFTYEDSTIFNGYPAKRQWYPFSSDIYEEILPSIGDRYPYPVKILFSYMAAAPYALPGGQTNIAILTDLEKVPLYVANDCVIGEMSMYADYIFPDLSYLERWEMQGSHPSVAQKIQPVRNPVVAPLTDLVTVFGEQVPISLESMIMGIAEKMGLPGFGKDGFGKDDHFLRPDDLYLRMVANIAAGDKPGDSVPDAGDAEMKLFEQSHRHLPASVFDPAKWQKAVGEQWWKKVVYVLSRGGRFQDYHAAYDGPKFKNKYGQLINLYLEKCGATKSAITGKKYFPTGKYLPISDVRGNEVNDEKDGFRLHLITWRDITQTKSRTVVSQWLHMVRPENHIVMHSSDAEKLGVSDGALVRVVSKSNPEGAWNLGNGARKLMIGKVKIYEGIRPGIIGFTLGHGHWANGSSDVVVDGKRIKGDRRRATGIHANAAMRLDDYLKNTCLLDPVGGSVSFYDTRVKLVKM